ncbi:MAG: hypothetical protein NE334_13255 [Lentisphaeraceae bacterium]|nr:hypothetical protein [Lentisphaeraceae bacterium]
MRLFLLTLFSAISILSAQDAKEKTFTFRSTIVKGQSNITDLKKSIQVQNTLKLQIVTLKYGKKKDAAKLKEAETRLLEVEKYHQKKYGMTPGLNYQLVNEAATVSLLLNDDQLNQIAGEKAEAPKKDEKEQYKKYPQFELNNAAQVKEFIMAAQQGKVLTNKIESLKKERQKKSVKEQKKIIEELKKTEETKDKYDAAMNKKYGVRPKLDYLVEVKAISLYLTLKEKDLNNIAKIERARLENELKKQVKNK